MGSGKVKAIQFASG
jgi:mRNA export factor